MSKTTQLPTVTNSVKLANEFSNLLNAWLTPEEIKEIVRRNQTGDYISCCASHDFCDANEIMAEAFTRVMGREFIFFNDEKPETEKQNEADTDLMNTAWAIAKKNNFEPLNK